MANSYLNRTISSSPTNPDKFTISMWVKRSKLGSEQAIMGQYSSASLRGKIDFLSDDRIEYIQKNDGNTTANLITTRKFRDTSAWYHLVYQFDTSQGTSSNRIKFYVNGVQETAFDTASYPAQDLDIRLNQASQTLNIGQDGNSANYFDGYISHLALTDGQTYAPTSFGQTDSTSGIWKFKSPSGLTFGDDGFHLKFENSGNLGLDSSGNSNTFTVNGSLRQSLDTPSNVYATLNPLDTSRGLSNGNTTYAGASSGTVVKGTLAVISGKYYAECKIVDASENMIGVLDIGQAPTTNYVGHSSVGWGIYTGDGNLYHNASASSYSSAFSDNDIMGIALDMDNNKLYFSKNGVWQNSGVPTSGSTGTGAISITSGLTMTFCGGRDGATDTASFNFGNGYFGTTAITSAGSNGNGSLFEYDVPTGFYALNTQNLNTYG